MRAEFLILLMAFPLVVQARPEGHDIGIGGDVVSCYRENNSDRISVEVLDLYEAREVRGIRPSLGAAELSVDQKVKLSLSRLRPLNPSRAARYERFFSAFMSEAMFVRGKVLTDIPDSQQVFLGKNCRIEQIVIQQDPRFDKDPRYVIDADLWDRISNDDRAALIVHELIWRELRVVGAANSIPVRYFNSLLFGDRLKGLSTREYIELAQQVGLPDYDALGLNLSLCVKKGANPCARRSQPIFGSQETLVSAVVAPQAPAWDAQQPQQSVKWNDQVIPVAGEIQFHPSQSLKKITLARSLRLPVGDLTLVTHLDQAVSFYENGRLQSLNVSEVLAPTNRWEKNCRGMLTFHENGLVKRCLLQRNARFKGLDYDIIADGVVSFDAQGRLNHASRIAKGQVNFQGVARQVSLFTRLHENRQRLSFANETIPLRLFDADVFVQNPQVEINPRTGDILSVQSLTPFALTWKKISGRPVVITSLSRSILNPGSVLLVLAENAVLNSDLDEKATYGAGAMVLINADGKVSNCERPQMIEHQPNICPVQ